ncbi:hypothetical protein [Hespellia stercorisuis]|uniref:Uncharacterized protein n=1 Tax=Hespellia stercorisuis DSM 15480 TaxID=1121950 RepID=A0A1M6KCQ5_9FIRM|nr:hypothetical protein [Hespellia stercorisuis]SHJ56729.1 hypothetical protein SAMN02745243_00891 [Hespellia stercorisuis DSM 15480]
MKINKKYHFIISLLICMAICFSFCNTSLESAHAMDSKDGPISAAQASSDTLKTVSQGFVEDIQTAARLISAASQGGAVFRAPLRAETRSITSLIYAVLFKIAVIPSLIFAVMEIGMRCQTLMQQLILNYIQSKDGRKKYLFILTK